MKLLKTILLFCSMGVMVLALTGCGKKSDDEKTVGEVRAEAEKMSAEQLRQKALEYKEAIIAKQNELAEIEEKLKSVSPDKLMEQTRAMRADVDKLNDSIKSLMEKYQIYYNKLKEKGASLSGLEID